MLVGEVVRALRASLVERWEVFSRRGSGLLGLYDLGMRQESG